MEFTKNDYKETIKYMLDITKQHHLFSNVYNCHVSFLKKHKRCYFSLNTKEKSRLEVLIGFEREPLFLEIQFDFYNQDYFSPFIYRMKLNSSLFFENKEKIMNEILIWVSTLVEINNHLLVSINNINT